MERYCAALKEQRSNFSALKLIFEGIRHELSSVVDRDTETIVALVKNLLPLVANQHSLNISQLASSIIATVLERSASDVQSNVEDLLKESWSEILNAPFKTASLAAEEKHALKRSKLQDSLDSAVSTMVHVLSVMPTLLPLTSPSFIRSIASQLWSIFAMQSSQLSAKICDILSAIFSSADQLQLNDADLSALLSNTVQRMGELNFDTQEISIAYMEMIHVALTTLAKRQNSQLIQVFNRYLPSLMQLIVSEYEEVRSRTKSRLISLIDIISTLPQANAATIDPLFQCINSALENKSEEDIVAVLSVTKEAFRLAQHGEKTTVITLVKTLSTFYEALCQDFGTEDANQQKPEVLKFVEECIGAVIQNLGAGSVLTALPLNITNALDGLSDEEPRMWMLPLLKKYVQSDRLLHWMDKLLPEADALHRTAVMHKESNPELAFKCSIIHRQVWETLPSFATAPCDIYDILEGLSEVLVQRIEEQPELKTVISRAIANLSRHLLKSRKPNEESMEIDDLEQFSTERDHVIDRFADVWLNKLVEKTQEEQSEMFTILTDALSAVAAIARQEAVDSIAETTVSRIRKAEEDGDNNTRYLRQFDIFTAIVPNLSAANTDNALLHVSNLLRTEEREAVQKKGYKMLASILENRPEVCINNTQAIFQLLGETFDDCYRSSQHFRAHCIKSFVSKLSTAPQHLDYGEIVASFLPEVLMGLGDGSHKEKNQAKKTLGLMLAHFTHSYSPLCSSVYSCCMCIDDRIEMFFKAIETGFNNEDSSVVSGTVGAFAILMETHAAQLTSRISTIIQSFMQKAQTNDDIAKKHGLSVLLDFIESVISRSTASAIGSHVPAIIHCLLEFEAPLNRARERTKSVLLELSNLVGFELVERYVPEKHWRIMRNLRKFHRRSESQKAQSEEITDRTLSKTATTVKTRNMATQSINTRLSSLSKLGKPTDPDGMNEAVDLLDPAESRLLTKSAAGLEHDTMETDGQNSDTEFKLPVNSEGKLIISERTLRRAERRLQRRHKAASGLNENTDGRSTRSTAKTKKTDLSRRTKLTKRGITKPTHTGTHHSAKRFKAKKGTGGDQKGSSRLEPYAYWKLDRRLLNKRAGKRAAARRDLKRFIRSDRMAQR